MINNGHVVETYSARIARAQKRATQQAATNKRPQTWKFRLQTLLAIAGGK